MQTTESHFPEPIDVRRIRLIAPAGACAVVSEFRTADQVLARWIDHERGAKTRRRFTFDIIFEITFDDGYRFCGCYEFWRGARRRPSLTRFVQAVFHAAGVADLSRYAIGIP
jgi:hypothetical protein